jgi:macrophage erythroblast attacher
MDLQSDLEYELRLQQYIELIRGGEDDRILEAMMHARKYLTGNSPHGMGIRSAGLLAFEADTNADPYQSFFSLDRWNHLAETFLETHHALFSLPSRPLLHIALSAGLSALKTPACHSKFVSPTSGLNSSRSPPHHSFDYNSIESEASSEDAGTATLTTSLATSVCPICSTELNKLARNVPYAHHSKSHVENDPVMLPNGRIYGRDRLVKLNEKLGSPEGLVRDPVEPDKFFEWTQVQKVFIS